MLQNLTKGKMVEWVVLLVALVALGLSIAAVAKPCSSNFADKIQMSPNGPILPGTADGKACRNDMACRGGQSYVCPPGSACVPREGKISNCVKGEKEKTFICGDGGGGGSGPTDCEVGGRVCCNDSEECPTAPHGKKIPVKCDFSNGCSACPNQYKGVCSDGTPPCQSEEGDDCGTTEKCCPGLTCLGNSCVKTSPTKPGHLSGGGGKKGTIGGGPGSPPQGLGIIGDDPKTESPHSHKKEIIHTDIDGDRHSGQDSHQEHDDDGKISNILPLILGITGGSVGAVILLVLVYLVMTKRLKL